MANIGVALALQTVIGASQFLGLQSCVRLDLEHSEPDTRLYLQTLVSVCP